MHASAHAWLCSPGSPDCRQAARPVPSHGCRTGPLFTRRARCIVCAGLRHPNVVQFMGVCARPPAMVVGEAQGLRTCAPAMVGCWCIAAPTCAAAERSWLTQTKPPPPTAEYCGKGSLTDVLAAGRASPQKAALLTWARRLNIVSAAGRAWKARMCGLGSVRAGWLPPLC